MAIRGIFDLSCLGAAAAKTPDMVTLTGSSTFSILHFISQSKSVILVILLPLMLRRFGMTYLTTFEMQPVLPPSGKSSKLTAFQRHSKCRKNYCTCQTNNTAVSIKVYRAFHHQMMVDGMQTFQQSVVCLFL